MERELCLVLDVTGKHRLVLKKDSNFEIDKYTSKNFEDSEQIRIKYQKEINEYLDSYKEALSKSNNPSYKGRIAVVDPNLIGQDIKSYQKRVLYKKHIASFNELIKSKETMVKFCEHQLSNKESLISRYIYNTISRYWYKKGTKTVINKWIKDEKENQTYYEAVRDLLFIYEQQRKEKECLPTFEQIYEDYKKQKEIKTKERINRRNKTKIYPNVNHTIVENSVEIEESPTYFRVNDNMYTIDELHLFDIEELEPDSDYKPDGYTK
ncbi:MAG: hypothetical protein J6B98_00430 [Bacilli bacterium]|nr:hypothetical protein [Bacilli bacterium]